MRRYASTIERRFSIFDDEPLVSLLRFREESHATRSREVAVVSRHWSPVRIGSLRCNKINSQRDTVGGRGCGSRSHADYVSDQERAGYARSTRSVRATLNVYTPVTSSVSNKLTKHFHDLLTRGWRKKVASCHSCVNEELNISLIIVFSSLHINIVSRRQAIARENYNRFTLRRREESLNNWLRIIKDKNYVGLRVVQPQISRSNDEFSL